MSALDQVLTIGIVKTEHPNLALQAAAELLALEAVAGVVKDLSNNLPDSEIELAREAWGNTNTVIVKSIMARLKLAMTQLHIARKAQE